MRILVCGRRTFDDTASCITLSTGFTKSVGIDVIISGTCRGADQMGERWAKDRGVPVERYPALWNIYGRAAGPIRNQQMLDEGKPDYVIAFPRDVGSRGTAHMMRIARARGIKVWEPAKPTVLK